MMSQEFNSLLKDIVSQNGISVLTYNLQTKEVQDEVLCKEHSYIVDILKNGFFNELIQSKLIAYDCINDVKNFVECINSGCAECQCDAYIKNEEQDSYSWFNFEYKQCDNGTQEGYAFIKIKSSDEIVHKKLLNSFWNKQINSGVEDGNSYFIIDLDDEIIYRSYGKLAIKTRDFYEQINYIASMCGDSAQKLRSAFCKENLLKYADKVSKIELMDVLIQNIEGNPKWYKVKALYAKHPISGKNFVFVTFLDIDAAYRETETVKYNATHDELTDVLNKRSFMDMSINKLEKLNNTYWKALIFIDIDNFKRVNDLNGHIIGDRVLRGIASGIKKSFRSSDIVGRVGGDEFMVLFSVPTLYALYSRLNLINSNIKSTAQIDNISASFGVVISFGRDNDFGKLYYLSDKAMYNAKKEGKNRYHIIDQFSNSYLNEVVSNIGNEKVARIMKLKITDYIFCHYCDDKVLVDYITPKLSNSAFDGKVITELDSLSEFLSKTDYNKLAQLVADSLNSETMLNSTIKIKNRTHKVYVSSNGSQVIIGLQGKES